MTVYKHIAKIERAFLGFEDHGIMTVMLTVSYGGSGQGVGGYCLGGPLGLNFVERVLRACGVDSWDRLVGRTIFVLKDSGDDWGGHAVGIENLPTEKGERFLFADWQAAVQAVKDFKAVTR